MSYWKCEWCDDDATCTMECEEKPTNCHIHGIHAWQPAEPPADTAELQQIIADWEQCGEAVMAAIGLPGKLLSDSDVIGELKALQYSVAGKQLRIDHCESLINDQQRRIGVLESQPDKLDELAAAFERLEAAVGAPQKPQTVLVDGEVVIRTSLLDLASEVNAYCDEHEQTPEQKQADREEKIDGLEAIVAELLKTANGDLIVPDMEVWWWNGFPDCAIEHETVWSIHRNDGEWAVNDDSPPHFFYSTLAAAEKARDDWTPTLKARQRMSDEQKSELDALIAEWMGWQLVSDWSPSTNPDHAAVARRKADSFILSGVSGFGIEAEILVKGQWSWGKCSFTETNGDKGKAEALATCRAIAAAMKARQV